MIDLSKGNNYQESFEQFPGWGIFQVIFNSASCSRGELRFSSLNVLRYNLVNFMVAGFQLVIPYWRIASQSTVIANHFFLFFRKSRIKNHFFSFTETCLFILFSTVHEFIQEMFLNNFH